MRIKRNVIEDRYLPQADGLARRQPEQGMTYRADTDPETPLAPLQSAACTYRIALGPRAGQKVLSFKPSPAKRRSPENNAVSTRRALAPMPRCCVASQIPPQHLRYHALCLILPHRQLHRRVLGLSQNCPNRGGQRRSAPRILSMSIQRCDQ
jgi:hypothetical protein